MARRCTSAADGLCRGRRGGTLTRPRSRQSDHEGTIAESLAGHRRHDLSCAASAGSSPCLGAVPRRWSPGLRSVSRSPTRGDDRRRRASIRARTAPRLGRRRRRGRGALGGPSAGVGRAADPRVPRRHRRRRGAPDGCERCRRDAAVARGRAPGPARGRQLDELRRRRALERGRRGDQRHRHRARRRPRGPGVRRRALQRGRAGVDVRGRAGARPRHRRPHRRDRSHEPDEHRAPALVRGGGRHRGRRRGAPAMSHARA